MKRNIVFLTFFLIGMMGMVHAVPAYPYPRTITQADGSILTIVQKGDERHHITLTDDGVLITQNNSGIYEYAEITDQSIRSTGVKAQDKAQRSVDEVAYLSTLHTDLQALTAIASQRPLKSCSKERVKKSQSTLAQRSIVILVNFSDVQFTIANAQQSFHNLLNQTGYSANGGTGSARDYFIASSDSAYQPQFDVYGPYTLPNNRAYYGANDSYGDDVRPDQMIIDACNLANADVDFTIYDTDNDGYVDNVFVYYAGTNEAEGGPSSSIWPHRWNVSGNNRVDNKLLNDYACTSELNGSNSMCGVGTFCHEFGHVLGLPDYYITDYNSSHHTLSEWDIMDYGSYLNDGRTPGTYSAYDRFFLGWLTPIILNEPTTVQLGSILKTNSAYLITQSGSHNLDGGDPDPSQFFILDNRQQQGWDAYLPGHGMIVTLVNYSYNSWYNNTVNNSSSSMGVDIVEADGKASDYNMSGDPYPGTNNVTSFTPKLRNGTSLSNMPITNIAESNGYITFDFMGGATTQLRTSGTIHSFKSTASGVISTDQTTALTGYGLTDSVRLNFVIGTHFELEDTNNNWVKSLVLPNSNGSLQANVSLRYNPQNEGSHSDRLIISSTDANPITIDLSGVCGAASATGQIQNIELMVLTSANGWTITSDANEPQIVKIYSITGQLLFNQLFENELYINKQEFAKGIYLLEISNEAGHRLFTQKISD